MTLNDAFDIEIHELNEESCEIRMPYKDYYVNELGACHGAIIMAIADTATGILAIAGKYKAPTQSSYTNFLNPILDTDYIYARAKIIKRGKRTVTVDCEIFSDDCPLAAINRSEYAIIDDQMDTDVSDFMRNIVNGSYKKY